MSIFGVNFPGVSKERLWETLDLKFPGVSEEIPVEIPLEIKEEDLEKYIYNMVDEATTIGL